MERLPEVSTAIEHVFAGTESGSFYPHWVASRDMEAGGLLRFGTSPALTQDQVTAIAEAASQLDDAGCYLSYVEGVRDFELEHLSFDRYDELHDPGVLDHVVVSRNGRWGVFVSHLGIAVVAGPEEFVVTLYRTLPPMKEQATQYASEILRTKQSGLIAWLKELLPEILGPEEAAAVFAAAESELGRGR
jgi:hypothetical protein